MIKTVLYFDNYYLFRVSCFVLRISNFTRTVALLLPGNIRPGF